MEKGASSPEALAEWFSREAPAEAPEAKPDEKKESRRGGRGRRRRGEVPEETRRGTPVEVPEEPPAKPDVNRMVAEEVARMRRSGELGPDDEVVVTVGKDGKLVVKKKG